MRNDSRPVLVAAVEFVFQCCQVALFDWKRVRWDKVGMFLVLLVATYGFSPSQPTRRRSSGCGPLLETSTTTGSPRPLAGSTEMMCRSPMLACSCGLCSDRMCYVSVARAWVRRVRVIYSTSSQGQTTVYVIQGIFLDVAAGSTSTARGSPRQHRLHLDDPTAVLTSIHGLCRV
jgi:hypothetical protein